METKWLTVLDCHRNSANMLDGCSVYPVTCAHWEGQCDEKWLSGACGPSQSAWTSCVIFAFLSSICHLPSFVKVQAPPRREDDAVFKILWTLQKGMLGRTGKLKSGDLSMVNKPFGLLWAVVGINDFLTMWNNVNYVTIRLLQLGGQ